jgi:hypothetical protein
VLPVLEQCSSVGWRLVVVNVVLGTQLLDDGLNVLEMAVIDGGEEMVLDLQIEATGEPEGSVAVLRERVRRDDLVRKVLGTEPDRVLLGEVVDLRGEHEADRVHQHGHDGEEDLARQIALEDVPLPAPQQDGGEQAAEHVHGDAHGRELADRHRAVEHSEIQRLEWHDGHVERGAEGPHQCRGDALVEMYRTVLDRRVHAHEGRRMREIRVLERHVGVGVVADDVLVVPLQRRRSERTHVAHDRVEPPLGRDREVQRVVRNVGREQPRQSRHDDNREPVALHVQHHRRHEAHAPEAHAEPAAPRGLGGRQQRNALGLRNLTKVLLDARAHLAGEANLVLARERPVELVLLDAHIGIDGLELCRSIVRDQVLVQQSIEACTRRERVVRFEQRCGIAVARKVQGHRTTGVVEFRNIVPFAMDLHDNTIFFPIDRASCRLQHEKWYIDGD